MDSTSPIPPIACNWRNYRYQCARRWEIPYVPRIEAFRSLLGTNSDVATQDVTPRPDEVHSTCNCRGTYVHQVPL